MSASKPVSGPGSLRDAIGTAAPGDTIAFNLPNPSVITLSSTLTINSNLSIQGPGATQLAVSGNNVVANVFSINVGVTVNISGLTIEKGNANAIRGGGINNLGTLTVTNCTLSDNSATFGGGIENAHGATLIVTNSTFSGNSAINGSGGGGINNLGTLTVTNCTFSDNSAGFGGGIESSSIATLTVTNSTFSGNSGTDGGGGIQNGGSLTAKSSLLAGNQGGNCNVFVSGITSQGYNLSDDGSCGFSEQTDKNNTPAGLASTTPQNNGGPTQTIALLPTSPALDAISVADCTDTQANKIATDQRGIKRPQGSGCDIGAFELVPNTPFSYFSAKLAILTGKPSGFGLTAWFSLGSANNGIHPLTEAITLQVANYNVTISAGSLHQLWNSSLAPYAYAGTISGTKLVVGLISLGRNNYQLDVAGSPVAFSAGIKNPVTVSLTIEMTQTPCR